MLLFLLINKDSTLYCHLRHNVYLGQLKSIGKGSLLEDNSAVGHGAIIGNGCRITNSVVGCDCIIGDGVIIEGEFFFQFSLDGVRKFTLPTLKVEIESPNMNAVC